MAKSLFVKGADFVAAMVFMFASTNLVLELGAVILVLLGWQFAASELVGGTIMIVLLALLGGLWLRGKLVVEARARLTREQERDDVHGHLPLGDAAISHEPPAAKHRSKAGWTEAATCAVNDLSMLKRELVIGYAVAGFLAVAVPDRFWDAAFIHGHGLWTTLENVAVGPLIAMVSFVCSIGNVPLAAALWKAGISFGGVVSFIFGDLIALPLLLVYRRYYGNRLTVRMLGVFWAVMSAAGLATGAIFEAAGLEPAARPAEIAPAHFSWDYTTYLDIVFLALFGIVYWVSRRREASDGDGGYAIDPVCGMRVETANAPSRKLHEGQMLYFCSDRCRLRHRPAEAPRSPAEAGAGTVGPAGAGEGR
jgi:uncharacterized membrane protein YraQ (UPF0718 family)/YHS domain-containing protein